MLPTPLSLGIKGKLIKLAPGIILTFTADNEAAIVAFKVVDVTLPDISTTLVCTGYIPGVAEPGTTIGNNHSPVVPQDSLTASGIPAGCLNCFTFSP